MKKIPLSQGKFVLVDDDDFDYLNQWKWHYKSCGYAVRNSRLSDNMCKDKLILMHRVIMGTPDGLEVDHINRNKLDNQKFNLRNVNSQQNKMNKSPQSNGKSQYKGIYWHNQRKKWVAKIKAEGRQISLGLYHKEADAALAYNLAAIKYFGDYAYINKVNI